jgi:hypothetical protein
MPSQNENMLDDHPSDHAAFGFELHSPTVLARDDELVVLLGFRGRVIPMAAECKCDGSKRSDHRTKEPATRPEIGRGRKRGSDT